MKTIKTFSDFSKHVNYSLIDSLNADPHSSVDGDNHLTREVLSGHYVPVTPTSIPEPEYISHSSALFNELSLSEDLVQDEQFKRLFSGDISGVKPPMRPFGWATGYALSIYGTEYTQQCPFGTGNGYGDGRAISVFEGLFNNDRFEMQLKGGGPTPYCRGADGRAVLRSSVREFLAQEYMHALRVPTSRSLTLYVSKTEKVKRPWYTKASYALNPDTLIENSAAITTRVAPSFLRVGQIELFARRVRNNTHQGAFNELHMIVDHLIKRNYRQEINSSLDFADQVVELAYLFRRRLISLVANWIRIGYCQGNFNSDNCAAGGFTLDYGPFGFCELFDPRFQPWTGGGQHFAFLNQQVAAEKNYHMFLSALRLLLVDNFNAQKKLDVLRDGFTKSIDQAIENMWAKKIGLTSPDASLINELLQLMVLSKVDYTIFFRKLSNIPHNISELKESFYINSSVDIDNKWSRWFERWRDQLNKRGDHKTISSEMKQNNPKYTWREWLVAPAYEKAELGDYRLIQELQSLFSNPYDEQTLEIGKKYDCLKPKKFFDVGGISHYSCSS